MAQINYRTANKHFLPEYSQVDITANQTIYENILQRCKQRFYSTPTTLESYKQMKKQFVTAGNENIEINQLTGLADYSTFKKVAVAADMGEILKASGLTQRETDLLLTYKRTKDSYMLETENYTSKTIPQDIEESLLASSLNDILTKLDKRESTLAATNCNEECFSDAVLLSRREYDTEVVRSGVESRALVRRKTEAAAVHPDHPINHLADLERQLFRDKTTISNHCHAETLRVANGEIRSELVNTDLEKKSKRFKHCDLLSELRSSSSDEFSLEKRADCYAIESRNENSNVCSMNKYTALQNKSDSLWDVKHMPSIVNRTSEVKSKCNIPAKSNSINSFSVINNGLNCKRKCKKDYSRGFVSMPDEYTLIPISEIKNNCISKTELQEQFANYNAGEPSRTLYIKNLSFKVLQEELVNIFGNFDTGSVRIHYRLLQGRMRGQAFIKFADEATATQAMESCLGYKIRNKPMVIEYGKIS